MARTGRPREFDRESAVNTAMNLFWEKGFESTSLADLRKTLGNLSSASFYAAFGSKQALFKECLERYTQSCGSVSAVLDNPDMPPGHAMRSMFYDTIAIQTSPQSPAGCMAVLAGLNCLEEHQEVEILTRQVRQQTREAIARCVARGVAAGELTDVNAPAFTLMLDCFIKGIAIEAKDGATEENLKASADQLLSLWR
ncbi:TetR/AcrR family transcriptional regulator [Martelella alba]|uniref:TetR/AcrR family transcriptional regulator n=1 Tax=Martelella alba TaxID=2590451 RepID=A0ABY2SEG9_9HYPH|nr:TetR/AcrR family transcriptional regulator [Martelella alba]TKI02277.1 TetR/AcrR family transcriptional regulator [Martelella alba]